MHWFKLSKLSRTSLARPRRALETLLMEAMLVVVAAGTRPRRANSVAGSRDDFHSGGIPVLALRGTQASVRIGPLAGVATEFELWGVRTCGSPRPAADAADPPTRGTEDKAEQQHTERADTRS